MLINELSKRTGVSISTIRFYENKGLLEGKENPEVTTNNYKDYDESTVERVNAIIAIKEAGFTLSEIKNLFEKCGNPATPYEVKKDIYDKKIAEVEAKMEQLQLAKQRLLEMKAFIDQQAGVVERC